MQAHSSDPRILGRRTLQRDHRYLAGLLRPGMSVLDIGCGTGAITAGIAEAVGPAGSVIGVDRDPALLALARQEHGKRAHLRFEQGDATHMDFQACFDIVTAARTLQWISEPSLAVSKMKQACKPAGLVVVLDYNHAANAWRPETPLEFRRFYSAFLTWRESHGWDNKMADHLPDLFRAAGLTEVESHVQDEIVERGDGDFAERGGLWSEVIDNIGGQLTQAGLLTEAQLNAARGSYGNWVSTAMTRQTLTMRAVVGRAA